MNKPLLKIGHCSICGVLASVYPDPPGTCFCEECCPDHEYKHDPSRRAWFCEVCDKQRPDENYDD